MYFAALDSPPVFDADSENVGNALTGAAGYGSQRGSIPAKIVIFPDAMDLSSGTVTTDTISISLVDADGQVVSSGPLAESLVVATSPGESR